MKTPHYLLAFTFMGVLLMCSGTLADGLRYLSSGDKTLALGGIISALSTILLIINLVRDSNKSNTD